MKKIILLIFIILLSGKGQLFLLADSYEYSINLKSPKKGEYFPVTHDKVMVRMKPDIKSGSLIQLNAGDMIKFIKIISRNTIIDGNEGRWAYVDTGKNSGTGPETKGWIFDYYLGYPDKFLLCTNCNFKNVSFDNSGITYHYKFMKGENFILRIEAPNGVFDDFRSTCKNAFKTTKSNCYFKGKVYKYRNILYAKPIFAKGQYLIIKNNTLRLLNFSENRYR